MEQKKPRNSNVKVAIRVRPALRREFLQNPVNSNEVRLCVACPKDTTSKILISKNQKPLLLNDSQSPVDAGIDQYTFDRVFWMDATQELVYNEMARDMIQDVFQGFNTTIFAYGQTGSGKTHTIFGERNTQEAGIAFRVIDQIFQQHPSTSLSDLETLSVNLSCAEIYNEKIYDLLVPGNNGLSKKKELKARKDPKKGFIIEGLASFSVTSTNDTLTFIDEAYRNRVTSATMMNNLSSRSHLVLMLAIEYTKQEIKHTSLVNIVDLAGSERVSRSGASGDQLKEAVNINLSLMTLSRVVETLSSGAKRAIPPYRDSLLTMILKESLGGNCRTHVIATISPSLDSASESISTLRFASSCRLIENVLRKNEVRIPPALISKKKVEKNTVKYPWEEETTGDLASQADSGYILVNTDLGKIAVFVSGPVTGKPLIYLHGNPSSSQEFVSYFWPLAWAGYRVYGIDQPGFGRSPGTRANCRSENNTVSGGPVDVLMGVVRALGIRNPVLCGFDWGGGICISAALKHPASFPQLVLILPSYWEKEKDELKKINSKVCLIWVPQDQLHPWSKWKGLAPKIRNCSVEILNIVPFKEEFAFYVYSSKKNEISTFILKFLLGRDPTAPAMEVKEAPKLEGKDTTGQRVTMVQNILFADQIPSENLANLREQNGSLNEERRSIEEFKRSLHSGSLNDLLMKSLKEMVLLFGKIPELNPQNLSDPLFLIESGIWQRSSEGWEEMVEIPRYFPGRQVLVRASVIGNPNENEFLSFKKGEKERVTFKGVVVEVRDKNIEVEIPKANGGVQRVMISKNDADLLNAPHIFKKNASGFIEMEDGLRVNYKSQRTKAKMLEIALKLAPKVENMDFFDPSTIVHKQLECLKVIQKCLNIVNFKNGVEKNRVNRSDSIGQLSINGQGHCHTLSSTLASFLQPFSRLLGIELKYRGGFHFTSNDDQVSEDIERHQWLEVTLRPSMQTFVCDLFLSRERDDQKYMSWPVEEAYSSELYPNGKLIIGSEINSEF